MEVELHARKGGVPAAHEQVQGDGLDLGLPGDEGGGGVGPVDLSEDGGEVMGVDEV